MLKTFFLLLILVSLSALGAEPLDIVFDIDQTIVTLIHDGEGGDWLADRDRPNANTVRISYTEPQTGGKAPIRQNQRYRVFEGLSELLGELKELQQAGRVRVSFFSGGQQARNLALLEKIKLPDGSSARQLAQQRIFGFQHLTPVTNPVGQRFRQRFKKDLRLINPDLSDIILIDDIREFAHPGQEGNLMWIDERFPYPERQHGRVMVPDPELLQREKRKYRWISHYLTGAIEKRLQEGGSLAGIVSEMTAGQSRTPFSPGEEVIFRTPRLPHAGPCGPAAFYRGLEALLK